MEVKGYMNTMKCQKSTKAKLLIWNESYKKHSWFWNFHYSYVASKLLTYKTLNDQDENYSFVHAFFNNYNGLAFF
jgi:hypothetical protein